MATFDEEKINCRRLYGSDLYCRDIYVSRAGDEEPSGEMYFFWESPAGNRRVNKSTMIKVHVYQIVPKEPHLITKNETL